jgi:hypothetical protein
MSRSLRSRQEETPDWTDLGRNTIPMLLQICADFNITPPDGATRWDLIRLIQARQSPQRSPRKGATPSHCPPTDLFSDSSDLPLASDNADIDSGPDSPRPSRLFPSATIYPRTDVPARVRIVQRPSRSMFGRFAIPFAILFFCLASLLYVTARTSPPGTAEQSAAKWIADIDGDCIFSGSRPTVDDLVNRFPGVDIDLLIANESFNVGFEDGYLFSRNPNYRWFCSPERGWLDALIATLAIVVSVIVLRKCFSTGKAGQFTITQRSFSWLRTASLREFMLPVMVVRSFSADRWAI